MHLLSCSAGLSLISLLVLLEGNIPTASFAQITGLVRGLFKKDTEPPLANVTMNGEQASLPAMAQKDEEEQKTYGEPEPVIAKAPVRTAAEVRESNAAALQTLLGEYNPPSLSLLERDKGRPGVGDIKGNANIIKRTLQNFGITVELDEISIGPSVTRYAIKPAEGVRLQKIISLQTNLELALAAHPVRIEAPIPGKSLVGIEVPNSSKVDGRPRHSPGVS